MALNPKGWDEITVGDSEAGDWCRRRETRVVFSNVLGLFGSEVVGSMLVNRESTVAENKARDHSHGPRAAELKGSDVPTDARGSERRETSHLHMLMGEVSHTDATYL